jgi:methionine synthase II (cobalamin-independent)
MSLRGLATGIGSLPHTSAEEALDLIFKYTPQIPFWPQLPKRDKKEAMVSQASEGIPCLKIKNNEIIFDDKDKDRELELFYEKIINRDIDYFKISEDFASGLWGFYRRLEKIPLDKIKFIKCQLCGPFTFAASINDKAGKAILHDKVMMQTVLRGLAMKALWQIRLFKKFNKPLIIFFDEPYLSSFGSAYTPINREEVIAGLTEITQEIKLENVLTGIHCCGNTDWSIFTDIESLDIISFDAYSFLDKLLLYINNFKSFFKRKGVLCWGIVPTTEFTDKQTVDLLIPKLNAGIEALVKKGIEKEAVLNQLFLSPSCGMGALDSKTAESILKMLSIVSEVFMNQKF